MSDVFFLSLSTAHLAYRLYENPEAKTDSACLLLHGAGVAGEITYSPMLPFLTTWRWMLIPDLTGMGASYHTHGDEAPVSIDVLTQEVDALIDHIGWQEFDVVGYSLGGLVALSLNEKRAASGKSVSKMALLEPASLEREDLTLLGEVRQKYRQASTIIRQTGDVELGIACFMDGVAPNRRKNPVAEATTQSRLAHRPFGFSYALDAVTQFVELACELPDRRQSLIDTSPDVFLLSGELSHVLLKEHYDALAERYGNWHHKMVSGCDHSLPFQKPRQIANYINRWFFSS